MRFRLILLSICLWSALKVEAFQVTGTVTDSSGAPLSFAGVYVKGTTYGVLTNLKGEYFIELERGSYTLVASMAGFEDVERQVQVTGNAKLNFMLPVSSELLETVVVSSDREDPAYAVIRKAIARRDRYSDRLNTLTMKAYIRAVLELEDLTKPDSLKIDSLMRTRVNLVESLSDVYYRAPADWKEVKTAYRDLTEKATETKGVSVSVGMRLDEGDSRDRMRVAVNNPLLFYTRIADGDFNLQRNLMDLPVLSSAPYTSPLANNALLLYRFRFIESFAEGDHLVYKIHVIPRLQGGRLFSGILYIQDGSFALKAAELELNELSLKFFTRFRIVQDYRMFPDSINIPVRQEFYYEMRESRKKTHYGQTLVRFSEHNINPPISSRFMAQGRTVFTDSSMDANEDFWTEVRPITLKPVEQLFIHVQDSIIQFRESPGYLHEQDSIYNDLDFWSFVLNGIVHRNRNKGTDIYIYPLIAQFRANLIDGYRHTLGGIYTKEWTRANELELNTEMSYGFLNKNIRGAMHTRYMYQPKKFGRVRLSYTNQYTMLTTYESIYGTFAPNNYVENEGWGIGHEMEWWNGFFLKAYADFNQYRPYTGKILGEVWDQFPEYRQPKMFEGFQQFVLDVEADITFAQQYELRPYRKVILGSKYPTIHVHYKKGIKPVLGSNVNYDFLELGTDHDVKLATLGLSRISIRAGRFLNDEEVRLADLKYFRGSDQYFFSNPLRSFQQISRTSMATSQAYLQAHYIHHFNGAILGKVPLLNRWSLQLVGGSSLLLMEENDLRHLELYGGLEKPFRLWKQLFRFTALWVNSESTMYGYQQGFKFGIDFYNSVSHSWMY
ncbi:MAG: carboxypeptidase-like regulatory domain-containing protein [Flavobacteriales bacterium]|nr:carboxypeptidase-like regulatory domain-containing protein [Flavobacteriales bacterium]